MSLGWNLHRHHRRHPARLQQTRPCSPVTRFERQPKVTHTLNYFFSSSGSQFGFRNFPSFRCTWDRTENASLIVKGFCPFVTDFPHRVSMYARNETILPGIVVDGPTNPEYIGEF